MPPEREVGRSSPDIRRLRFGPHQRLHCPQDFSAVLAAKSSFRSQHFVLKSLPTNRQAPRLGLVIGRKLARRAILRNRIKRVIRESFRLSQGRLGGLDIVVRLNAKPETADNETLRRQIDDLLGRLQA